jgi:histidine ammonia-lyase
LVQCCAAANKDLFFERKCFNCGRNQHKDKIKQPGSDGVILLDGNHLGIESVVRAVRQYEKLAVDQHQLAAVGASRRVVEAVIDQGQAVYGINTGFGKLADVSISPQSLAELQRNLILSHCSGVGEFVPLEIGRAMLMLRANALMKGYSGVRPELIRLLVEMFNRGVTPAVPQQGSVGASGDLVPLAHMSAVLLGEGRAWVDGQLLPGAEALRRVGLTPLTLEAKEGLALINGTQYMTAYGVLGVYDAQVLAKTADIAGVLTMEALGALPDAFDAEVHRLRPHPGQMASAENVRKLIAGSGLINRSQRQRIQDAYSLRCIPQVHGATRDAIRYAGQVLTIEINSVTDNPVVLADGERIISAGNFHGQPVALATDFLGIAVAEMANISERRIERLVNPALSGLPPFLVSNSGLNSGYMISQYTAAALVSENKVLAHPGSVDSIPTSANQEDHVSMGSIAAKKLRAILENAQHVLAIELVCACQALEFVERRKLGPAAQAVYGLIRSAVPPLVQDRIIAQEIGEVRELITTGRIAAAAEAEVGKLH